MFNKKVLAGAIIAATTMGSVAQLSAMELSEKGVGQALIGPLYFAQLGFETDVTVVNTRTDAAVKAKVVFRSSVDSVEVLDFIIYLSPGDVWRGTVQTTGTGNEAQVTSTDASMRTGDDSNGVGGVSASTAAPITQAFNTSSTGNLYTSGDTNDFGHMDILGVYAIPNGTYSVPTTVKSGGSIVVKRTMTKDDLAILFAEIDNNQHTNRNQDFNKCTVEALQTGTGYDRVSSISPCALELTGLVTLREPGLNRASYTMHALAACNPANAVVTDNFFGAGTVTEASATTAQKAMVDDNLVVANYRYNEQRAANSHLAYNWGLSCDNTTNCAGTAAGASATTKADGSTWEDGADGTRSNLQQYDKGIARTVTSWEYDADTTGTSNILVTFPSRYLHRDRTNNTTSSSINFFNNPCGTGTVPTSPAEYYSYPFKVTGEVGRSTVTYDNEENRSTSAEGDFSGGSAGTAGVFKFEVNYISHADMGYYGDTLSPTTGGWGHVTFTNSATSGSCSQTRFGQAVGYSGFPALTLVYKIAAEGRMFEKSNDSD